MTALALRGCSISATQKNPENPSSGGISPHVPSSGRVSVPGVEGWRSTLVEIFGNVMHGKIANATYLNSLQRRILTQF